MATSACLAFRPEGMPLGVLSAEAGLHCPEGAEEIKIFGVTADSRRVQPGWLFVAIRGMKQNGGDFTTHALERGAVAVVGEKDLTLTGASAVFLTTDDPRETLADLCDAWYDHPAQKLRLVGVSGTNGKTSVSSMLAHILQFNEIPCGIIGTVGVISPAGQPVSIRSDDETANMTTPDPEELYAILATMAVEGGKAPVVVMEVTSHALALRKVAPLRFEVSIFTNLTPEHLDFHETMEAYYAAKKKLFTDAVTRTAVVNADDPYGRRLLTDGETHAEQWLVCHTQTPAVKADMPCVGRCCQHIYAGQIKNRDADGVEYRLLSPDARVRLLCPVPGEFTVSNSLEAAVAARALGVTPTKIKEALACFRGVAGRMERVPLGDHVGFSVFLDYAHTPDALGNLLATANGFRKRGERIVLLFGCGGDRDSSKRAPMAAIASRMADMVIITSDNSRTEDPQHIISDILAGMAQDCDHVVIPDRAEAIQYAIRYARRGDIILLAGKGHENYELDANGKHPFCEKDIVISAAEAFHPKGRGM